MLPGYGNAEQEIITRAFQMANFDSIARLPSELVYTNVPILSISALPAVNNVLSMPSGTLQEE